MKPLSLSGTHYVHCHICISVIKTQYTDSMGFKGPITQKNIKLKLILKKKNRAIPRPLRLNAVTYGS